jgi:hypothetical protein
VTVLIDNAHQKLADLIVSLICAVA